VDYHGVASIGELWVEVDAIVLSCCCDWTSSYCMFDKQKYGTAIQKYQQYLTAFLNVLVGEWRRPEEQVLLASRVILITIFRESVFRTKRNWGDREDTTVLDKAETNCNKNKNN
jgi:hypothetical protein